MSHTFADFCTIARSHAPRVAIVLGSGLGSLVDRVEIQAAVRFADVPGFAPPTVHGHSGRVVLGLWCNAPVLMFQGRMHFYEGHDANRVTGNVRLAHDLGITTLILTNAAGGIHDSLNPGDWMVIAKHLKLLSPTSWQESLVAPSPSPYAPELIAALAGDAESPLLIGTYAALTGPCYETPAEIRALKAMGADAVGMSTAMEAEAAAALGMRVAAMSCITNKAAGLSAGVLDHADVQEVAGRGHVVERFAHRIERIVLPTFHLRA